MNGYPHPHLDKLEAACRNEKCLSGDKNIIEEAKENYRDWIQKTERLKGLWQATC